MNREELLNDLYARIEERGTMTKEDGKTINELKLQEFDIPDGVTEIEDEAFKDCRGWIGRVTIPDSVIKIGKRAFIGCADLGSITIPDSVRSVGEEAFAACRGMESAVIGKGIDTIASKMFAFCFALKNVTIPDSVKRIENAAFIICPSLDELTIPASVKFIGKDAFTQMDSYISTIRFEGKTLEQVQSMVNYPWGAYEPERTIVAGNSPRNERSLEESLISKWRKLYLKSI